MIPSDDLNFQVKSLFSIYVISLKGDSSFLPYGKENQEQGKKKSPHTDVKDEADTKTAKTGTLYSRSLSLSVSTRAEIHQFLGRCSTVQPAKFASGRLTSTSFFPVRQINRKSIMHFLLTSFSRSVLLARISNSGW